MTTEHLIGTGRTYYVVRWRKPAGWYEEEFDNHKDAFDHFVFESNNPVVEECEILERTDILNSRYKYGNPRP